MERFAIARATLTNMRPMVLAAVALLLAPCAAVPAGQAMGGAFQAVGIGIAAACVLGFFALVAYLNLPGHVRIGNDGLYVDRRDGGRYVPFSEVASAATYSDNMINHYEGVALTLHSGEVFKLPMGQRGFPGLKRRQMRLVERIEAAQRGYQQRNADAQPLDAAPLNKGARTAEAWLTRLRGMASGANATQREAPVPTEKLWRIIEEPHASASTRAAAAAALGPELGQDARTRLRVAADATAQPELRQAFASAAAEDEAALVEALEALDTASSPQ